MGGAETSSFGSNNDDGLIPRFLHDLFDTLRNEDNLKTTARISFLEIYCDEIRDLLVDGGERPQHSEKSASRLIVHEDDYDVWVEGLQQIEVENVDEALTLLKAGRQRQTTAVQALNEQSSRSHVVYTLDILRVFASEMKHAKLTFVDLAGSERAKKILLESQGMKEGSHINTLGNVINVLGSRERLLLQRPNSVAANDRRGITKNSNISTPTPVHVPYRSSKLTRLLRDALGGNSETLFMYDKHKQVRQIATNKAVCGIKSRKMPSQPISKRVMINQSTQYEYQRKFPVDYVLLSPSQIFREVHSQKQTKLTNAPSPWPRRRRLDVLHNDRSPSAALGSFNTSKEKNSACCKTRNVLQDILQHTQQLIGNRPDLNGKAEFDAEEKEEQSSLSFDEFVDRMTELYDKQNRLYHVVRRHTQRFRHLASLLGVLDIGNQISELSKYTLENQQDALVQHLETLERLAADRLWTRLQHRETAIENYAEAWNVKLTEAFISEDQYETCMPWHTHREDHEYFQHHILPFILNGWISVTQSNLDCEQLWLTL
ncbi:Kinesin [Phytophthora megakarya]|uniref:Kinesin-like protein n=1 Tax=Phytophthora megakarya TaxID=4795 RepID=A0A225W327_9STRA|nr:Kinesin [Phytophthora megakarya]